MSTLNRVWLKNFFLLGLVGQVGLMGGFGLGCSTLRPGENSRSGLFSRMSNPKPSLTTASAKRSPEAKWGGLLQSAPDVDQKVRGRGPASSTPLKDWGARELNGMNLRWPVKKVQVTSHFGMRDGQPHEGIDLRAPTGTPIFAAQEGTVIYAGQKIAGYGKLVVIRHAHLISTVYAHNSKLQVRVGQYVRQGQQIALSGNTGQSRGPHLHFEVRKGVLAMNPIEVLGAKKARTVASSASPSSRAKRYPAKSM